MTRSLRCRALRMGRVCTFGLMGAVGLAGFLAGAGQAQACEGFACVGEAIGQGAHDTGVAIEKGVRATGRVFARGAYDFGSTVEQGARATGRAVGQVAEGTARAVNGHP
jgi:hypothetical protein